MCPCSMSVWVVGVRYDEEKEYEELGSFASLVFTTRTGWWE